MGGQQAKAGGQPGNSASGAPGTGKDAGFTTSQAKQPTNKVQLAVSQLGGVPGAAAYHSSIVVNNEEFFFSDAGISVMPTSGGLASHRNPQNPNSQPTVFDMGMSQCSGSQLKATLERHFLPGTYDLLRKNCNSFSDCALFYLLHVRLDSKYRALEKLGAKNMNLVQAASGGQYTPNPKCEGFDLEKVIESIDPEKVWSTPGQATGGATATSAEAMRAARLARLGGAGASSTVPSPTPAATTEAKSPAVGVSGSGGI